MILDLDQHQALDFWSRPLDIDLYSDFDLDPDPWTQDPGSKVL